MISKKILSQYDLGEMKTIKPIASGLTHDTYRIRSSRGDYIIQRLHPVLASKAMAKDFYRVTKFLGEQGIVSPECVLTKKGEVVVDDGKYRWRVQTMVKGLTFHEVKDAKMAREAGAMFARFHKALKEYPYAFLAKKIMYQTKARYDQLVEAAKKHDTTEVQQEFDLILEEFPKYFLPDDLPLWAVHGDPKISNILFSQSGEAVSIIDLDTCNTYTVLSELGDMFRSWCGNEEDDPKNKFCLKKFRAAWKGYESEIGDALTARERKLVSICPGTITLELASRFLTDYFNDSYFGWDATRYSSRKEHNLARTRGQIAEFLSYKEKFPKIEKIVNG